MIHIAILKPSYIQAILSGAKTIESRLTKTAQPPYDKVKTGERLYLKASGGPFMATAIAGEVSSFEADSPCMVDRLYEQYGEQIRGDADYWQAKRDCRYITLIELTEVKPIEIGPPYKPAHMKAWYVLNEDRDPLKIARLLH